MLVSHREAGTVRPSILALPVPGAGGKPARAADQIRAHEVLLAMDGASPRSVDQFMQWASAQAWTRLSASASRSIESIA